MAKIEIEQEEYDKLVADQKILRALEGGGVNSWEGYEWAMESLDE